MSSRSRGLPLLVLGAALACTRSEARPTESEPDPRVRHLSRFVLLRRASDQAPFFLDRFETCEPDRMQVEPSWHPSREPDLPLCNLSLAAAAAMARRFWGRLPSFDEWRSAVEGSASYQPVAARARRRFPWGEVDGANRLRANTLALQRFSRTRVGTFESGRDLGRADSPYDLFGNVAEWTLSPYAPIALAADLFAARDRAEAEAARDRFRERVLDTGLLPAPALVMMACWPATPFLPELSTPLDWPAGRDAPGFVVAGFSYAQSLPPPHVLVSRNDELGVHARFPGEWASDVGMRIATDGYTLLSALERMNGAPTDVDRALLGSFLLRHRKELLRAARLRLGLDRAWLGVPPPGEWAVFAYGVLGAT